MCVPLVKRYEYNAATFIFTNVDVRKKFEETLHIAINNYFLRFLLIYNLMLWPVNNVIYVRKMEVWSNDFYFIIMVLSTNLSHFLGISVYCMEWFNDRTKWSEEEVPKWYLRWRSFLLSTYTLFSPFTAGLHILQRCNHPCRPEQVSTEDVYFCSVSPGIIPMETLIISIALMVVHDYNVPTSWRVGILAWMIGLMLAFLALLQAATVQTFISNFCLICLYVCIIGLLYMLQEDTESEKEKLQLDEAAVVTRYLNSLYDQKMTDSITETSNDEDNNNDSVSAVTFSVDVVPRHRNTTKHQKSIASVSAITEGTRTRNRNWDRAGDESVESASVDIPTGGRKFLAKERSL